MKSSTWSSPLHWPHQRFSLALLSEHSSTLFSLGKPQHKGPKPLPRWFVAPIFRRNVHVKTGICMILPENRCHRVPVWVRGGGSNGYLGNAQMNRDFFMLGLPLITTFLLTQGHFSFRKFSKIVPLIVTQIVITIGSNCYVQSQTVVPFPWRLYYNIPIKTDPGTFFFAKLSKIVRYIVITIGLNC